VTGGADVSVATITFILLTSTIGSREDNAAAEELVSLIDLVNQDLQLVVFLKER
jgi:hypothetical protein